MNLIPGASELGWGFNIFGSYSRNSLTSQLFSLQAGSTWKDPLNGNEYIIPGNISQSIIEKNSAGSYSFQNRTEVQEFFSAKAGVEANYVTEFGAFSGEFNFAYGQSSQRDSHFQYALYEADNVAWELGLESQSLSQLTSELQEEINGLPAVFSPVSKPAFFRFFNKYGTHFVSRVKVGGRLNYYVSIAKSYIEDIEKIKSDVSLEFNALITVVKAQSESEWSTLGKSWTENRTVHIETIGGTPSSLLLGAPEFDDNRSEIFTEWVNSIKSAPATIDFQIKPLYLLFPNDKAEVAEEAFHAYFSDHLVFVESIAGIVPLPEPTNPSNLPIVTFLGSAIQPEEMPKYDFGFLLVVAHPITDPSLNYDYIVLHKRYYSLDLYSAQQGYTVIFDQMLADLKGGGYNQPGFLIILASFNWYWQAPPTGEFLAFLQSAGAGKKVESWLDGVSETYRGSISSQDSTYILIGVTGAGPETGVEALSKASIDGGSLTSRVMVRLSGLDIHEVNPPLSQTANTQPD